MTPEKALPFLLDKVAKAKNSGLIRFEVKRSKKRDRNFFPLLDRDNKVRQYEYFSTVQTRKNICDRENDVYY